MTDGSRKRVKRISFCFFCHSSRSLSSMLPGNFRILEGRENQPARGGLQYAGNRDIDFLSQMPARVFHDDHRAVFQVGYPLPLFFAFFQDMEPAGPHPAEPQVLAHSQAG